MLRKRLIFTLLLQQSAFQLSRNFSLQSVGDFEWLRKYYQLSSITGSIDELVLLNVSRQDRSINAFCESISQLSTMSFMPLAAGGGIRSIEDAYRLLDAGADKLVLNTPLLDQPGLVEEIARTFGSQCVVASLDFRRTALGMEIFSDAGRKPTGIDLAVAARRAEELGAGELYVTSIDRDGTGQGYDLESLALASDSTTLPVVASGGVGDFRHFVEGLSIQGVTGASTANIFNFMSDGLTQARRFIESQGLTLAHWELDYGTSVESRATADAARK